tara:strand:+ start:311 stop:550 length:240 start_codon:yes stop_codon:yes gene_type:complete
MTTINDKAIKTPDSLENLMINVMNTSLKMDVRVQNASLLTTLQMRIDKLLNAFHDEYEVYIRETLAEKEALENAISHNY